MFVNIVIVVMLMVTFSTVRPSYSKIIYVDCEHGDNLNSGLDVNSPKLNFQTTPNAMGAAALALSGDTIVIKRGTTCNFMQTQDINKSVHITSNSSFYKYASTDPWPILNSYSKWTDQWSNISHNIWKHNIPWQGHATYIHYVRFSSLQIDSAGSAQQSLQSLTAARNFYYYAGTSDRDPPFVAVYSPRDPANYYGPIYYSYNAIFSFTSIGHGQAVSSGMTIDSLTFAHVDIGISIFPIDNNFSGGVIENIRCIDVHRCVLIEGNNSQDGGLSNFVVQKSVVNGASGPGIQVNAIYTLHNVLLRNLYIAKTGLSESYGGIYTMQVNASATSSYRDFQIINNFLTDCRTGNLYMTDGACIENDSGTLAVTISNNTITNSHQCYHSNAGGLVEYSTSPYKAILFANNTCQNTDSLALVTDSRNTRNAYLRLENNKLSNGSLNKYAAELPRSNGFINIYLYSATRISITGNSIGANPSLADTVLGIVDTISDPSRVFLYNNTFNHNTGKIYYYIENVGKT